MSTEKINNVKALRMDARSMLMQLANDDRLADVMVVCYWDSKKLGSKVGGKSVSIGHSGGLSNAEISYGIKVLDHEANKFIFGDSEVSHG